MGDEFLDLIGRVEIDLVNRREIAAEDGAAREQEVRRVVDAVPRQVTVTQEIAEALALGAPVFVEARDGQRVGDVDLVHEIAHLGDNALHGGQSRRIDCGIGIDVDWRGYAANEKMRVRVLATENSQYLGDVALPAERFQVMRYGHQVCLGRQLVGRVTPIGFGENAQLTRLDEVSDLFLHVGEVAGGALRIVADALRKRRGCRRIRRQSRHDIDPVQCVQVIEMHHVVVHVLGTDHQVTNEVGVRGDLIIEGVLDGAHGGDAVHECADAANSLRISPGITRISAAQDDLDSSNHRAG